MSVVTQTRSDGVETIRLNGARPSGALGRILRQLRGDKTKIWLRRKVVGMSMNVVIAAAVAVSVAAGFLVEHGSPGSQTWGVAALKLFALWCLSFLPGWLYVRFLGMRAKALWNEYVLNLHRLGWDKPWHLPEPPHTSEFHDEWQANQDPRPQLADNIYQQKFEAYYGRQIPRAVVRRARGETPDDRLDYLVSSESLFPVFLATAVLAAGWAAVLWDTRFITAPSGSWDVLKYAFLGAYAFVTGMLLRRFFQGDLRPSAYASSVLRIVLVLLIVAVLHQQVGGAAVKAELAAAFVIGFFPLVGLHALQRVTAKLLRQVVPPVTSEYPLDQLDGLNLWYEARLIEEGVEDMQNLTTMNLVDVILHTRVPVGRLVDWTDQAFLLIHLDRADRAEINKMRELEPSASPEGAAGASGVLGGALARVRLRQAGIRTATDLLKVFSVEQPDPSGEPQRTFHLPPDLKHLPLPEDQLRLLVAVLAAEPGLAPIWNWQRNGVPRRG